MKRFWVLFVFCLFAATFTHAQGLIAPDPGNGVLTTTGNWRFHTGDDLRWLAPTFDDSGWESISADEPWGAQTHPGYAGFAWYRRDIELDNVTGPRSIYLPEIEDAYELYFNGERIGGFGQLRPTPLWHQGYIANVFSLPGPDAGGHSGHIKGVLAIRVWKAMLASGGSLDGGGLNGPPVIGDTTVLTHTLALEEANSERARLFTIILHAFFFVVGFLAIGIWAFDRNRKLPLWLGVYLLGISSATFGVFPWFLRSISFQWNQIYLVVSNTTMDLSIWMLILVLFGLDRERVWRRATTILAAIYLVCVAVDLIVIWFWSSGWQPIRLIDGVCTGIITFLPAYLLVLLFAGLRRRRDLTLLPAVLICALRELYDLVTSALGQGVQFTHFNALKIVNATAIHLGPYSLSTNSQIDTILLVVLVATLYREQARERNRQLFVESELKAAQEIQSVLVPEETPSVPGFAISSLYWPAGEVGGDMFQVIPGPAGDVLIILADVSGKGLKAAMTVSLIVGAVRTLADTTTNPLTILAALNQRLIGRSNGGFTTGLVLHVSSTGVVTLANAGHLPPFLNGEAVPLEGSLPLGLVPGTNFPVSHFQLEEGDDLTLYTDGVLEAQRESGELFGFDRTAALLSSRPTVRTIAETARTFGQADDITVVKITRTPTESTQSHISIDLQTVVV